MPCHEASYWNARYRSEDDFCHQGGTNDLLRDHAGLLPEHGIALDAAAGVASNGLFLLERGLRVVALDISEVALQLATRSAAQRLLRLQAAVIDLTHLWLPTDYFDVIVNFFFLERSALLVYQRALRPGGILFVEALLQEDPDILYPPYYLESGELRRTFEHYEVIHWKESKFLIDQKTTEQMILRKPLANE